jgi:hypothetical protein
MATRHKFVGAVARLYGQYFIPPVCRMKIRTSVRGTASATEPLFLHVLRALAHRRKEESCLYS